MYKLKIVVDSDLVVARTEEKKNCRTLTLQAVKASGTPPTLYDAIKLQYVNISAQQQAIFTLLVIYMDKI